MQEEKIRWFHDMTWDEKESYIFNMIAWPVFILMYGYPFFPGESSIFSDLCDRRSPDHALCSGKQEKMDY